MWQPWKGRIMDSVLVVACLAVSLLTLPLGAQHHPPAAQRIEVPDGGVTVPMGDLGGRPTVDVRVNGKGPYRFILDTGANATVVGDDLRDELALPASGMAGQSTTGGPAEIVSVDDLRIGDAALSGVVAGVGPLSRMFRGGEAPRGVLSAASFPGYLLVLDYPAKRVLIRKGELPPPDSRTCFEYTAEQMLPNVPVRIAGIEVRVHVDSGSPGALTLPSKYLKELPLASTPSEVGRARTPHGEFPVWSAQMKGGIELGRYTLDLSEVRFSDVNPIPGPPVGNIGYGVLQRFIVTLDSKNRRIRLEQ
jgi:hypothetical protein